MSVLELKGEILEKIASIESEEVLLKILEFLNGVVEEEDLWDFVPDTQIERLDKILENSANRADLMTHEEAKKRHAKWLSL
jgi:hypothetical protein